MSNQAVQSVYDFTVKDIKGQEVSLASYSGKLLLIVNTASKCGFTPQYDGLEKLYQAYKDRGLEILGFPCNQFLAQEPGSNGDILDFCRLNYGVTFPLFAKIDVRGEHAESLFRYLTNEAPFKGYELEKEAGRKLDKVVSEHYPDNYQGNDVKWNFTKFLVDRGGKVIGRYEPSTTPEELDAVIGSAL